MKLRIEIDNEEMSAVQTCETLQKTITNVIAIANKQMELKVMPEFKMIEISFEGKKIDEDMKNKNDITIFILQMKKDKTEEQRLDDVIFMSIEVFIENWLKYRIKQITIDYDKEKCLVEIPRGFNNPTLYYDSLCGYHQDSFLWKSNYDITDELHKVGGLKDDYN